VYAAVVDPGDRFLAKFREALIAAGISVNKTDVTTQNLANSGNNLNTELAAIESPPLSELVKEINRSSNNLYAEAILRHLGESIRPNNRQKPDSSADAGLAVVTATLAQRGVNPDSYILADGSGLSRHNLISPEALIQTLRVMAVSPWATLYRDSLPTRRLSDGIMVQAKSGGMSGISSLAGYISLPDYDPLVFAIILNHSDNSGTVRRQGINQILDLLGMLRRC
jgi:D-alanyl-D-alanine carboxypeptidase/D-alanyl-D-alanine-endopeptidase (penicillin-binding protein 4)